MQKLLGTSTNAAAIAASVQAPWANDIAALQASQSEQAALLKAIGFQPYPNPFAPMAVSGKLDALRERLQTAAVKRQSKLQSLQQRKHALSDHLAKGTMPPTLRMTAPKSLQDDPGLQQHGGEAFQAFTAALANANTAALQSALAVREAEITQLQGEIDKHDSHVGLVLAILQHFCPYAVGDSAHSMLQSVKEAGQSDQRVALAVCVRSAACVVARAIKLAVDQSSVEENMKRLILRETSKEQRKQAQFPVDVEMTQDNAGDHAAPPATKADIARRARQARQADCRAQQGSSTAARHAQKAPTLAVGKAQTTAATAGRAAQTQ